MKAECLLLLCLEFQYAGDLPCKPGHLRVPILAINFRCNLYYIFYSHLPPAGNVSHCRYPKPSQVTSVLSCTQSNCWCLSHPFTSPQPPISSSVALLPAIFGSSPELLLAINIRSEKCICSLLYKVKEDAIEREIHVCKMPGATKLAPPMERGDLLLTKETEVEQQAQGPVVASYRSAQTTHCTGCFHYSESAYIDMKYVCYVHYALHNKATKYCAACIGNCRLQMIKQ